MRRPDPRRRLQPKPGPASRKRGKSDPFLFQVWLNTRKAYFPNRPDLDEYVVCWSSRSQLRTLASCSIERRRVVVARELNNEQVFKWLEPLLYHEMCHAYLGMEVSKSGNKFQWHGKEFKALEKRHPMIRPFDAWVKDGGWSSAIRSDRAKRAHAIRKAEIDAPETSSPSSL